MGIEVRFVDASEPANFARAADGKTKAFYGETIGNPKLDIFPIAEVAALAHDSGIPLIIDNTMASPYLCRPLDFGADIVIHSATKYLGGHGTSLGGIIVDSGEFDWGNGNFPIFTTPDESYHGLVWRELPAEAAPAVLHPQSPCEQPARHGAGHLAVQFLPHPAGCGDAAPAHAKA